MDESKKALEKKGVSVKTMLKWGRPADEILTVADKEGVDLIALGCKGKHLSKRFLGSVSGRCSGAFESLSFSGKITSEFRNSVNTAILINRIQLIGVGC